MKTIVAALGGGAATDKIWGEGVHITGEKYVVTKAEDRSIYGRKVRFFKTNLLILSTASSNSYEILWY
jgi:hypothetical protein